MTRVIFMVVLKAKKVVKSIATVKNLTKIRINSIGAFLSAKAMIKAKPTARFRAV